MALNDSPSQPSHGPGRPTTDLEPYKDYLVQLFREDNLPRAEIAIRLNAEYGLDISKSTISRRLQEWGIPRKKVRAPPSQELRDRVAYHYNLNKNDTEMVEALNTEGYDINARSLARLRQKLNLKRRAPLSEYYDNTRQNPPRLSQPRLPRRRPKSNSKVMKSKELIPKVTAFVEKYMSNYDGSHDFNHIRRVVGLAHLIYHEIHNEPATDPSAPEIDLHTVTLSALLHDVGDKKYLKPDQDSSTLVLSTLLSFGAAEELAMKVQRIVLGVSYSSEIKNPAAVVDLIGKFPELAIVQDADRLDAIGAVGIGRTFTFGGAKGAKHMGETIAHFEEKLEKLEGMMKTEPGKRLARERAERLKIFRGWWDTEQQEAEGLLRKR